MEVRTVDGAGWVRVFVEGLLSIAGWATQHAAMIGMVAAAGFVLWLLVQLVTRP